MTDTLERVMIFIDGSNMYHYLKSHFQRTDIDFGCFCSKIAGHRRLVRIYYYNAEVGRKEEPERFNDQKKFFTSLGKIPYMELRLGRLVYSGWPATPPYEKGVDVLLSTDMLSHGFKNNFDTAILVAGDSDFVSALQAVKDNGKNVEVALFGKESTSVELRKVADKIIAVDGRLLRNCWKQQRNNYGTQRPPQES
ncbi:LabA-like NYN domain-containing protein [Dehalococcoides mccartyi]